MKTELVEMIKAYTSMENFHTGGNLHVILGDYNVDDQTLVFCENLCFEEHDTFGIAVLGMLKKLSVEGRLKTIDEAKGYKI